MHVGIKVGAAATATALGGGAASLIAEQNEDGGLWALTWLTAGGAVGTSMIPKSTGGGLAALAAASTASIGAYALGRQALDG